MHAGWAWDDDGEAGGKVEHGGGWKVEQFGRTSKGVSLYLF